jgi:putative membrane protein
MNIETERSSAIAWKVFIGIYLSVFAICAVSPHDRGVWWAENLPILLLAAAIALLRRWHPFSATAYALMLVLLVMHTIGGHYTFERVPFDLVTRTFGFARNHYDRVAHFSVGFYAYALAEILWERRLVRSRTILLLFPVFTIFTVAALYELFEWQYALLADPSAGIAVLGSQGDTWDAQKDMLADGLGAVAATIFFALRHGGAGKS